MAPEDKAERRETPNLSTGFQDWAAQASTSSRTAAAGAFGVASAAELLAASHVGTTREKDLSSREAALSAREAQLEADFAYVVEQLDARLTQKKSDIQEAQGAMQDMQRALDERERPHSKPRVCCAHPLEFRRRL